MANRILAIDIGTHQVTALAVASGLRSSHVEDQVQVALSDPNDFEASFGAAMDEIAGSLDLRGVVCLVSLPSQWITFRRLRLPFKAAAKIRQVLPFELEPTLAEPIDAMSVDFMALASDPDAENADVLAACTSGEQLNRCLEILNAHHLEPEIIAPGSFPTAVCFWRLRQPNGPWALIDETPGTCSVYFGATEGVDQVRTFSLNGNGAGGGRRVSLATQIQHTRIAYESGLGTAFSPERIFFSGNAPDAGLAQALEGIFGAPVESVNLARTSEIPIKAATALSASPGALNNALALALMRVRAIKGLNFAKGQHGRRLLPKELRPRLMRVAILALAVLVLGVVNIGVDTYFTNKKLARLDAEIETLFKQSFPQVKRIVDPLQQMRVNIKTERDNIQQTGVGMRGSLVIEMFNDISSAIPAQMDMQLTSLVFGSDNAVLTGFTDQFNSVNDAQSRLQQLEWVDKATITAANMDKSGKKVRFKIRLTVR